jgi:hypothetical protein
VNGNATTEALAFPDDLMIDWAYYDDLTGAFPMWRRTDNGSNINWANALSGAAGLTIGAFSDFFLPNIIQLKSLVNFEYAPYTTIPQLKSTGTIHWSATTSKYGTTTAFGILSGATANQNCANALTKTNSSGYRYFPIRIGNITEL